MPECLHSSDVTLVSIRAYCEPDRESQPDISLIYWWKGRGSNPRARHYELAAPLKIGFKFNSLPRDVPLRLAQRSTTEHDRLPQISRISWPRFWRLHPGPGTSAALTSWRNDFSNRGLLRYYLISLDCIGSPS